MKQGKIGVGYAIAALAIVAVAFFSIGRSSGYADGFAVGQRTAQQQAGSAGLPHWLAFRAQLTGANVVPAVSTAAAGQVDFSYDTHTRQLSWKGTYRGLKSSASGATMSGPAQQGENAGVQFQLIPFTSPFAGSTKLSEAQEQYLLTGSLYITVQSRAHPNGELRGQVLRVR